MTKKVLILYIIRLYIAKKVVPLQLELERAFVWHKY